MPEHFELEIYSSETRIWTPFGSPFPAERIGPMPVPPVGVSVLRRMEEKSKIDNGGCTAVDSVCGWSDEALVLCKGGTMRTAVGLFWKRLSDGQFDACLDALTAVSVSRRLIQPCPKAHIVVSLSRNQCLDPVVWSVKGDLAVQVTFYNLMCLRIVANCYVSIEFRRKDLPSLL
ncbi:hypothetical protein Acr_24g0013480 [Actinidia rufa]|uniref:Uncharacterized protein n=1 Tax=Actinidia rufa TaxID=165716 RepID=A0A7J0GWK5_9ERIC|nr:hypothetical protein Acr_24g0013480 [Actinidia rufa]